MVPDRVGESASFLRLGAIFVVLGFILAYAGAIPILGMLLALFAPDVFLLGFIFLSLTLARFFASNAALRIVSAALLVTLLAGNSRFPAYLDDLRLAGDGIQVFALFKGSVGQAIHIVSDTNDLRGRQKQYDYVSPACSGDYCMSTKGFSPPAPWIESNYWHENVQDVVLGQGFSIARADEKAPTLAVRARREQESQTIELELRSAEGKVLGRYTGRFRHGFPLEAVDGEKNNTVPVPMVLQYLLHGNALTTLARLLIPSSPAYPVKAFLEQTAHLSPSRNDASGNSLDPIAIPVALEVLESKVFDPLWVIKGDRSSGNFGWAEIAYDSARSERCRELLQPEKQGVPATETWYLFVHDATGRKKVRYPVSAICDEATIWLIDYVALPGRTLISKYLLNGDLVYAASFNKPADAKPGYFGGVMTPTLNVQGEYVSFEWWNANQSGADWLVSRSMKVRFKEPLSQTSERLLP